MDGAGFLRATAISAQRHETASTLRLTREGKLGASTGSLSSFGDEHGVKGVETMLADMRARLAEVERGLLERQAAAAAAAASGAASAVKPGLE